MTNSISLKSVQTNKQQNAAMASAKIPGKEIKGLRNLLIVEMKDIYWGEKALAKAIPKMIKNAATVELVDALTRHLSVIKKNIIHLEDVFYSIGEEAVALKSEAVSELINEAQKIIEEIEVGKVRDVRIISEERNIQLHKITTYGVLCYFAKRLGEEDAIKLLEDILKKEKDADIKFSEISEFFINSAEASCSD